MNNIRLLTGGLVLIVLGLAGGTGYLIYERIQGEVASTERVTKQDVEEIRTDVTTLKDNDKVQSAKIEVLEDEMVDVKGRVTSAEGKLELQDALIKKLQSDTTANSEEIKAQEAKREKMQEELDGHKAELDAIRGKLEEAEIERKAIREQLKSQGERIDAQEERLNKIEKKGDARDEEIAALRAELAALKKQLGLGDPPPEN
jgi:chromosome segregation ATPase